MDCIGSALLTFFDRYLGQLLTSDSYVQPVHYMLCLLILAMFTAVFCFVNTMGVYLINLCFEVCGVIFYF